MSEKKKEVQDVKPTVAPTPLDIRIEKLRSSLQQKVEAVNQAQNQLANMRDDILRTDGALREALFQKEEAEKEKKGAKTNANKGD
jgi:hypothetical protein